MSILIYLMWAILALAAGELVYGAVKRSPLLIAVGVIVLIMCALGLYLAVGCADSIYITGEGQLV